MPHTDTASHQGAGLIELQPDRGARLRALSVQRELAIVLGLVLLLIAARSLVFVLVERAQFDADQAVMGLTAKHIAQGRAFPFYQYAQSYVMVLEAWLAAPSVALFGLSVASLRLPLVLMNVAAGWLLVWLLVRELGLRPQLALVPALLFAAASPALAAELVTALGGNIEPFVFVLLLWLCRSRPVLFGVIFVIGFLTREFTLYALPALVAVEILEGRYRQPGAIREKAIAAITVVALWQLASVIRGYADVLGPGTRGFPLPHANNAAVALGFICPDFNLARVTANLDSLVRTQMATLLGTSPFRLLDANIDSPTWQGLPGFWPLWGTVLLVVTARAVWLSRRSLTFWRRAPGAPTIGFGVYLILIGVQSGVAWAITRCGPLSPLTLRYALLAVLAPVGALAVHLALEKSQIWRAVTVALVMSWLVVSVRAHADLAHHFVSQPRSSEYRLLADELVKRNIRYVMADYWAAYMISFLTDEQITATATDHLRILAYDRAVERHRDETILISRRPCEGGEPFRHWYFCPSR